MYIVGSLFVMREIEIAHLMTSHVTIEGELVHIKFIVSKSDVTGKTCTRSWGCTCGPTSTSRRPCAYHAAVRQRELLRKKFGDKVNSTSLPFFPNSRGGMTTKEGMVSTFEALALRLGLQLEDGDGTRQYSGHSARVSGCQFLAALGIEVYLLQLLARHAGGTILRYVRESPLRSLTEITREKWSKSGEINDSMAWKSEARQLRQGLDSILEKMEANQRPSPPPAASSSSTLEDEDDSVVVNASTGVVHKVMKMGAEVRQEDWLTACRWKFGFANSILSRTRKAYPTSDWCVKCWAMELQDDAGSDESTESSP
jgi:hypothetical protein